MATRRKHADEPVADSYRAYFSIDYYEFEIRRYVATVLEHGRALVGLDPLPSGETLTAERFESEADAAEPFVRARLLRSGFGFLTLDLSEDEWETIADGHQRPYREPAPLDQLRSEYDRVKAEARNSIEAGGADVGQIEPEDDHAGGVRTRRTAVGEVVRS